MDRLRNKRAELVILDRGEGTTCTINLHGATIVSWKLNYIERLFVSKLTRFDNMWPIRGGIPIIFPQFGYDNIQMPNHGFARINKWKILKEPQVFPNGDVEAILYLNENSVIFANDWNYKFELIYKVVLLEYGLELNMIIQNFSENNFKYNFAFHTYFKVPDVTKCEVIGLKRCSYCDKSKLVSCKDMQDKLVLKEWTDRIYQETPDNIYLKNAMNSSTIKFLKKNLPDIVLWNPWNTKGKEVSHFDEEEYTKMICLKPGYVFKEFDLSSHSESEHNLAFEIIE